jgi:hypothetical protein
MLSLAVLLPKVGTAQVFLRPEPYPQVTAANALWQLRGEPIFHAGAYYYPTGPTVFFDGNIMRRTGTFEGIPLYEDATQAPFAVVYVPIGGNVVRPYERLREGDLAGTVGSRPPSFPIERDGEVSVEAAARGTAGIITPPINGSEPRVIPEVASTLGTPADLTTLVQPSTPLPPPVRRNAPTIFEIWIPFDGARWYNAGAAVPYTADRFVQIGDYRGFPVYRDKKGPRTEIFVPTVSGGPVAPYKRKDR